MITDNYEEEPFIEKPKHGWLKLLLLLIIIGGLAYGGYYYYVNYYNNPVQKVNTVITNLKDKINEKLKSTSSIGNKAYKVNGLVKVNINSIKDNKSSELFNKIFNNLAVQIIGEVDTRNNINNLDISSKLNNEKLINGKIYIENNNIYVRSDELYERFILLDDIDNIISLQGTEIKDISILYNSVISSFIKNLDTNNAVKTNQIVKYNNNNIEANEYKISLTSKAVIQLARNIYNDLKNDSEFMNTLKKIDNDAQERLEKELFFDDNISDQSDSSVIYEINFYTTKDITNEKLIKISQSYRVGNINLKLDIDFIDEDTYLITIDLNNQITTIKLTINSNIFSIDFNSETDKVNININANFNYEEISTVLKEDVSNSIKSSEIDDLSEEEKERVDNNIKENKTLVDFLHNVRDYLIGDYNYDAVITN